MTDDRSWDLFVAADPARGVHVPAGDVESLLHRAGRDVTSYHPVPPARRRFPRFLAVGVAFAAVLAVGAGVLVLRPSSHRTVPGVTPTPSSTSCLTPVADHIARTAYDGKSGRYEYLRTSGITYTGIEMPKGGQATEHLPDVVQRWYAADGTAWSQTTWGTPTYPDAASRTWFGQHPDMSNRSEPQTLRQLPGKGSLDPMPAADPTAMRERLYRPSPGGPAQALQGLTVLATDRILDAAHRAAALRFLAGTDGVQCLGTGTDPTGRSGLEIAGTYSLGTSPDVAPRNRAYLLIDPRTGEVLASGHDDQSDKLAWTTVFLERRYTDTVG